jgi:hypothetical protein
MIAPESAPASHERRLNFDSVRGVMKNYEHRRKTAQSLQRRQFLFRPSS